MVREVDRESVMVREVDRESVMVEGEEGRRLMCGL